MKRQICKRTNNTHAQTNTSRFYIRNTFPIQPFAKLLVLFFRILRGRKNFEKNLKHFQQSINKFIKRNVLIYPLKDRAIDSRLLRTKIYCRCLRKVTFNQKSNFLEIYDVNETSFCQADFKWLTKYSKNQGRLIMLDACGG